MIKTGKGRVIEREESWGKLAYNTKNHKFSINPNSQIDSLPYAGSPIVLNVDLTLKCNMNCIHCVAKDMEKQINDDLHITKKSIDWINKSSFMVVVITGGEPLLPEREDALVSLISGIKSKGVIVDTNGTIIPSKKVIDSMLKKNVLLRVSLDSVNPRDESYFRRLSASANTSVKINEVDIKAYYEKCKNIERFKKRGIKLAVQTVLSTKNEISILDVPELLDEYKIEDWYIQRFIPSYKAQEYDHKLKKYKYELKEKIYQEILKKLDVQCRKLGIDCRGKKEKRHNSVFLLVGDGYLYTQSNEKPGEKIKLGNIDGYFASGIVSLDEHSVRYYGSFWDKEKSINNKKSNSQ